MDLSFFKTTKGLYVLLMAASALLVSAVLIVFPKAEAIPGFFYMLIPSFLFDVYLQRKAQTAELDPLGMDWRAIVFVAAALAQTGLVFLWQRGFAV